MCDFTQRQQDVNCHSIRCVCVPSFRCSDCHVFLIGWRSNVRLMHDCEVAVLGVTADEAKQNMKYKITKTGSALCLMFEETLL